MNVVVGGGGWGRGSPPFVKEKSLCGMNTFVYSFGLSIFSPVGLWLLERRCRLAPSQKESIFLPLLHFSLSASFFHPSNSIFSPKRHSLPSVLRRGMLEGIWKKQSTHTHTRTETVRLCRAWGPTGSPYKTCSGLLSHLTSMASPPWCIFIAPSSQLLWASWDQLWPIYGADVY